MRPHCCWGRLETTLGGLAATAQDPSDTAYLVVKNHPISHMQTRYHSGNEYLDFVTTDA